MNADGGGSLRSPVGTARRGVSASHAALLRLHNLRDELPPAERSPFPGVDLWRWQYFEDVRVPRPVRIPIDDPWGWILHPQHRVVYDKLFICWSQSVASAPHGVPPRRFPVFSKPIVNLHGMGVGGFVIRSADELEANFTPGHFWMRLLTGRHLSTDVALVRGVPHWWRHTVGHRLESGTFDDWVVLAHRLPRLEARWDPWLREYLNGYTGIVNFESIGGVIIECHLRMAEQWVDLNGPGWLESVVDLYARGRWRFDDRPRTGHSIVLFGPHGRRYRIDPDAVEALRAVPGVSSIQITFDARRPLEHHAMPPGGFRLAIVNSWDLATGRRVRARLARLFTPVADFGQAAGNGAGPQSFDPRR